MFDANSENHSQSTPFYTHPSLYNPPPCTPDIQVLHVAFAAADYLRFLRGLCSI